MASKHILNGICDYNRVGEVSAIDPSVIEIEEGWNDRIKFSGHAELKESIRELGVIMPLVVKKTTDGRLVLRRGERRLRAVMDLKDEGLDIRVPVIIKNSKVSDADLLFEDYCSNNTGNPFLPTEEGARFKRLVAYGYPVKEIAKRVGKSGSHVHNRIDLAQASQELKSAVDAGEISINAALEIIRGSNGNIDRQESGLQKAKRPHTRKKLIIGLKHGEIKRTGIKQASCRPLERLVEKINTELAEEIEAGGYNPASVRIVIERKAT